MRREKERDESLGESVRGGKKKLRRKEELQATETSYEELRWAYLQDGRDMNSFERNIKQDEPTNPNAIYNYVKVDERISRTLGKDCGINSWLRL